MFWSYVTFFSSIFSSFFLFFRIFRLDCMRRQDFFFFLSTHICDSWNSSVLKFRQESRVNRFCYSYLYLNLLIDFFIHPFIFPMTTRRHVDAASNWLAATRNIKFSTKKTQYHISISLAVSHRLPTSCYTWGEKENKNERKMPTVSRLDIPTAQQRNSCYGHDSLPSPPRQHERTHAHTYRDILSYRDTYAHTLTDTTEKHICILTNR